MRLKAKVAAITGAANGIGRATALRFAGEGATLALLDREEDALAGVVKEATALGAKVLPIVADLTDRPLVVAAFKRIESELGELDILVNNVGQSGRERSAEFFESQPEVWDFVLSVSLMTTMICSRQVVPGMRARQRGHIVNIATDTAFVGDAGLSDYAAAKAGVIGFSRSLARELAPFGVNVNAVCPGATRTRMIESLKKEILEAGVKRIPMGRYAEPSDIANAITFLSSDEASYITGQCLLVNGGRVFN